MTVSFLAERTRFPATGLFGGGPGARGAVTVDGQPVDPKATHVVDPGRVIELTTPGGGGFGDPRERDIAHADADVAAGYVAAQSAGASATRRRAASRRARIPRSG